VQTSSCYGVKNHQEITVVYLVSEDDASSISSQESLSHHCRQQLGASCIMRKVGYICLFKTF